MRRNLLGFVILLVILVFSLSTVPGVQASSRTVENDNLRVYEGDLVIEPDEKFVLKNEHLIVKGDVVVKNSSKLVLENSRLGILQRYKSQFSLKVRGGSVEVVNSTVEPYKGIHEGEKWFFTRLSIRMLEGSLKVQNSNIRARIGSSFFSDCIIENSRVAFLYWVPTSNVRASDSIIASFPFDLKEYTKSGHLILENLRPRKKVDISLKTNDEGSLVLENTLVLNSWSVNFEFTKKEVTIKNSDIRNVWIKFPPTENRIKIDLGRGYFEHFSLENNIKGVNLPYNVILENTSLNYFKPEMFGTKAKFVNTYAMIHPYEKSDLIFENSIMFVANIYGTKRIELVNSKIIQSLKLIHKPVFVDGYRIKGVKIGAGGTGLLIFENTVVDVNKISVACENYTIKGSVEIESPSSYEAVYWTKGVVKRTYPIIMKIKNTDKNSLSNFSVRLIDNEGDVVWKGKTDENGRTSFTITFNENNYDKNWKVETDYPAQEKIERKVNFLCDTPIVVMPKAKAEPEFSITDLSAAKGEVKKGETTTVSVKVTNTGGKKGTYTAELSINGEVKTQSVTLKPDESEKVTFKISREKAGTYEINVGELSKSLNVRKPEKPEKGIPWLIIGGVIVVVIAISAFVLYRRK